MRLRWTTRAGASRVIAVLNPSPNGVSSASEAEATPVRACSSGIARAQKPLIPAPSRSESVTPTDTVYSPSALKPTSAVAARIDARTNSAARTIRSTEAAACVTTSMERRRRGDARSWRAPSPLSGVRRSAPRLCHAGATPAPAPMISVAAARNRYTSRSGVRSAPAGASSIVPIVGTAQYANVAPTVEAITPRARLSVTSCRTIRQRLAPSAARTPISRSRVMAVEMRTVATFAHDSNKTRPITAITKTVMASVVDADWRPKPTLGSSLTRSGDSACSAAATPLSCPSAWATVDIRRSPSDYLDQ